MAEKPPQAADGQEPGQAWKSKPCPICGKPSTFDMRPFCSKRCADVDLHRWLGGVYAIPVSDKDEEDEGSGEGEG